MSALEDKQDGFGGPDYVDGGNPSADAWTGLLEDEIDSFGGQRRGQLYEVQSNKGAVNGYAPLDAAALVASDDLGTGGSDSGTKFLLDDQTFRILAVGDIPSLPTSKTTSGIFPPARLGINSIGAGDLFLSDDGTYKVVPTVEGAEGGTVTNVSIVTANGFSGTVANSSTTPAITLSFATTLTEGAGLAGNTYSLLANRTLALGTPSSLTAATTNSASGTTHTHAIASSSNPGAAASILATDASGFLTLKRLTSTTYLFVNASTANLYLKDTSTGFRASVSGIITPQPENVFRSTTYESGLAGWNISNSGDAEFNNVRVRGELAASVFKISEISATAGTFGVFYSAAALNAQCITAALVGSSFTFDAKNSDAGGVLFSVDDIVRLKSWTIGGIADSWATITDATTHTTYTTYTATLNSGSTGARFGAGTAVVDYGPSDTGFITLSTDGTVGSSPNLTMATHAGSPWSAFTTLLRLGNLNGSYGYATDVYGLGIGQYGAADSWLTMDATDGLQIFGGAGAVTLGATGLTIEASATLGVAENSVTWKDGSDIVGQLTTVSTSLVAHTSLKTFSLLSSDQSTTRLFSENDAGQLAAFELTMFGSSFGSGLDNKSFSAFFGSGFIGCTIGGLSSGAPTIPVHKLDVYGAGWFEGDLYENSRNISDGFTAYTPTVTASSGTFTTVSATARYKRIGKIIFFNGSVTCTTIGSAATRLIVTVPVASSGGRATFSAMNETTFKSLIGVNNFDFTDKISFNLHDGSGIGITSGQSVDFSGYYEAA